MLILDLWGIRFHAVIVFGLGKNILFKSVLGHCDKGFKTVNTTKKNSDTTLWIARIFCLFSGQISKMPEWQPLEFDQISSNQANL